jgi:HrpA-like RNA helicase
MGVVDYCAESCGFRYKHTSGSQCCRVRSNTEVLLFIGGLLCQIGQLLHCTRLLFCTRSILLCRLLSDPDLVGVTHVIVDEVHERTLEGDLLLLLLHWFLQRSNNTLHVILMSATVDAGLFVNYFRQGLGYSPPVMAIPGFRFPVLELYLEDALELTGYKVGCNSHYATRKKATPTEDVSQSAGLVSQGISSLM